jgi:hypothetical protein
MHPTNQKSRSHSGLQEAADRHPMIWMAEWIVFAAVAKPAMLK